MISVTLRGAAAPGARRTPVAVGVVALVVAFFLAMAIALAQEDAPARQTTIDSWRATLADAQETLARLHGAFALCFLWRQAITQVPLEAAIGGEQGRVQ